MVVKEHLALNLLASSCLSIVYTNREFAAVKLCLRLRLLLAFLSELASILSSFLVVNTL